MKSYLKEVLKIDRISNFWCWVELQPEFRKSWDVLDILFKLKPKDFPAAEDFVVTFDIFFI